MNFAQINYASCMINDNSDLSLLDNTLIIIATQKIKIVF